MAAVSRCQAASALIFSPIDAVARRFDQQRVLQEQKVGLKDSGLVRPDLGHSAAVEGVDLVAGRVNGRPQAPPFTGSIVDGAGDNFRRAGSVERRRADGDAGGGGDAFQLGRGQWVSGQ
jgi:hypothetical protein